MQSLCERRPLWAGAIRGGRGCLGHLALLLLVVTGHPQVAEAARTSTSGKPDVGAGLREKGWHPTEAWRQMVEQAEGLEDWGLYDRALKLYEKAREVVERQKGEHDPATQVITVKIGMCLLNLGNPDGEKVMLVVYEQQKALLPQTHPALLNTRHMLASVAISKGEFAHAEKELKDIVDLRATALGPSHSETLNSRENLAFVFSVQGRHAEAESQIRLLYAADSHKYGAKSLQACAARDKLGQCLNRQNRFEEALTEFQEVLDILTQEYGARHPVTFAAQHRLLTVLMDLGKNDLAEQGWREVRNVLTEMDGAEGAATLSARSALCESLARQGKLGEAEKELRQVVEVCLRTQGEDSLPLQEYRDQLSQVLLQLQRVNEADVLLQVALTQRRKLLGEDHPVTLDSWLSLATCQMFRQDFEVAADELRKLVAVRERVQGYHHEDTWISRIHLADVLRMMGRAGEALPLFVASMQFNEQVRGPLHPFTLKAMNNVAITLATVGRIEEARDMLVTLVKLRGQVMGPQHPDTIRSRVNLAAQMSSLGEWQEAERQYRSVLEDAFAILGPQHQVTMIGLEGFTEMLCLRRRPMEAAELLSKVLRAVEKLGPGHDLVIRLKVKLSMALMQEGRLSDVEPFIAQAKLMLATGLIWNSPHWSDILALGAWSELFAGRNDDASAITGNIVATMQRSQGNWNNPPSLRARMLHAVALKACGHTTEAVKMADELLPHLKKICRSGQPILQVPQTLRKEGDVALTPLLHAIQFSQMLQPDWEGDRKPSPLLLEESARPVPSPDRECQTLADAGNHAAAYERYKTSLEKLVAGKSGEAGQIAEFQVCLAGEAALLGKEDVARMHVREMAQELKARSQDEFPFVVEYLSCLGERLSQGSERANLMLLARLMTEETAAAWGEAHQLSLALASVHVSLLLADGDAATGDAAVRLAERLEKVCKPEDERLLEVKIMLLRWHVIQQEFHAAQALALKLADVVEKVYGEASPQNIEVRGAMAEALEAHGSRSMAVSELKMVLADSERVGGAVGMGTVRIRHRLARLLIRASRIDEGMQLHLKNLSILEASGTKKHPLLVELLMEVTKVLLNGDALRNLPHALTYSQRALDAATLMYGAEHPLTREAAGLCDAVKQKRAVGPYGGQKFEVPAPDESEFPRLSH